MVIPTAVAADTASVEVAFSPDGGAENLVLGAINDAQRSVRLMAYSLTAEAVVRALISARRRGVDVAVAVDYRNNIEEDCSGRARAALGALTYARIRAWSYCAPHRGGLEMKRKRRRKEWAPNLRGARLDVVGAVVGTARGAVRKHRFDFDDNSVVDLALEAATELTPSLTDSEIESVANRLLGRPRIDERDPDYHCWHLY
jgi:hypothetical protein